MKTTTDLLGELEAKASPRAWVAAGPAKSYIVNSDGDHLAVTISQHRGTYLPFVANAQLMALAVNDIGTLVEALEERPESEHDGGCSAGYSKLPCKCSQQSRTKALAALYTDLEAALKEVRDG